MTCAKPITVESSQIGLMLDDAENMLYRIERQILASVANLVPEVEEIRLFVTPFEFTCRKCKCLRGVRSTSYFNELPIDTIACLVCNQVTVDVRHGRGHVGRFIKTLQQLAKSCQYLSSSNQQDTAGLKAVHGGGFPHVSDLWHSTKPGVWKRGTAKVDAGRMRLDFS